MDVGKSIVFNYYDYNKKTKKYSIGKIKVVDKWFDSESNKERISYDIFVEEDNCLYKHIPIEDTNTIVSFALFLYIAKLKSSSRVKVLEKVIATLENEFDINEKDNNGNTILHLEEILTQKDLVEFAIDFGAFIIINNEGKKQIDIAKFLKLSESVTLLEQMTEPRIMGIKCDKCGGFIENKSKFCPWCRETPKFNCNKKIPPDYDINETLTFCFNGCSSPIRFSYKYCPYCGIKLK